MKYNPSMYEDTNTGFQRESPQSLEREYTSIQYQGMINISWFIKLILAHKAHVQIECILT